MERVYFLARVQPDRLEEYRARHRVVWPEMAPYFADLDGARPDEGFRRIDELFHLDLRHVSAHPGLERAGP
jgi:L-rhamnose mutarotase